MKSLFSNIAIIVTVACMLPLMACHDEPDYKNDIYGNFDALVDIVDSRYCFFEDKDIDWRATASKYREQITPETNEVQLFFICSDLLDELKDGHVNLSSRFDVSYYRNWWTDYPIDFNFYTVQKYYLDFNWLSISGIYYKELEDRVGYMYYPSFSNMVGETALDYVLAFLYNCRGLIIDIRDNGGGALTNINTLVGRFIDKKFTGAYIQHKTGPAHNDFSEPYPIEYEPAGEGRIKWDRPVIVVTNRSCFSAANTFVSVMKELPNVRIVGAQTGGGGGMPMTQELPNGWSIRMSECPLLNANKEVIEAGVAPTPGCERHSSEVQLSIGKDAILDYAIELLKKEPLPEVDQ